MNNLRGRVVLAETLEVIEAHLEEVAPRRVLGRVRVPIVLWGFRD